LIQNKHGDKAQRWTGGGPGAIVFSQKCALRGAFWLWITRSLHLLFFFVPYNWWGTSWPWNIFDFFELTPLGQAQKKWQIMLKIFKISSAEHREMILQGLADYIWREKIRPENALILYNKLIEHHLYLTKSKNFGD